MNIVMENGCSSEQLSQIDYDFAFCGDAIDERCASSVQYIATTSKHTLKVTYDASQYIININNKESVVDDIDMIFTGLGIVKTSKIILDCTSLGVAELLILIQTLFSLECKNFDVLYVEPHRYYTPSKDFLERRRFSLSKTTAGFIAIPGHALSFENNDKAVVLCGFEGERVGRAFEELALQGKNCQLIFGVPPYTIGWDMHSYLNHLSIIETNNISNEFYYCAAANPLAIYEKLSLIYAGIERDQKLFILPLGTKPMALGACLFKVYSNKKDISILYDHPVRNDDRSSDIAKWNLYRIIV